jgi:hypothetical protein
MALAAAGAEGRIARALAGVPEVCDEKGNRLVGDCQLSPSVRVRNSVLIDAVIDGGDIEGSVLIGTRARSVTMKAAFDVLGTMVDLNLAQRAGTYRVLSRESVVAASGERLTTLFFHDGPLLFRVHEDVDLRDRKANYETPICGNPLSFAMAHQLMSEAGPDQVQTRRQAARAALLALLAVLA